MRNHPNIEELELGDGVKVSYIAKIDGDNGYDDPEEFDTELEAILNIEQTLKDLKEEGSTWTGPTSYNVYKVITTHVNGGEIN